MHFFIFMCLLPLCSANCRRDWWNVSCSLINKWLIWVLFPFPPSEKKNPSSCIYVFSFEHEEQQQVRWPSVTLSIPPLRRLLPGAGLRDGSVESAEQHDWAGPLHQTGTALAPHRGSPAVKTGPQLKKKETEKGLLGARTGRTSERRLRLMLRLPLGSFKWPDSPHGNVIIETGWNNLAEF